MKKIIALALALIMALSMASVAFAADAKTMTVDKAPGEKIVINDGPVPADVKKEWNKISYDFTSAAEDFNGASLIESVAWEKNAAYTANNKVYDLVITLKENLTSTTDKNIAGRVTLTAKTLKEADGKTAQKLSYKVTGVVGNEISYVEGAKKAADAIQLTLGTGNDMVKNTVMFAEDSKGFVYFENGSLTGTVELVKDEKAQVYFGDYTADAYADTRDAIEAYLGEDYEAIVEEIVFEGTGFKNEVAFRYDAWEEDPHFFYAWDGEKFVDLEAKYDADEDVDDYVFTAPAKGIIIVTDVEIVAAEEETKNPDTGANDVVGVAAALAVVSLVAAGAVSLKK